MPTHTIWFEQQKKVARAEALDISDSLECPNPVQLELPKKYTISQSTNADLVAGLNVFLHRVCSQKSVKLCELKHLGGPASQELVRCLRCYET